MSKAHALDDRDPLMRDHWIMFDPVGRVVGCHCGFQSDLYQQSGYGDDVADHLLKVARQAERDTFNIQRNADEAAAVGRAYA